MSKSTLSALIKRLRKSGYLCFGKTPGDVRKKQVCPTEKLLAEQEEFFRRTSRMEAEFDKSLSSQILKQPGTAAAVEPGTKAFETAYADGIRRNKERQEVV